MIRRLALLLSCCLPLSTLAQVALPPDAEAVPARQVVAPQTDPARQALDAWLVAFNSNERKQFEAFRGRYQPTMDVDDMLDFHHQTGGFRLLRREPAASGSAQMLVQEHDSDTVARVKTTLRTGKPLALDIERIERPADPRIPRLDQVAVVDALAAKADAVAKQDAFAGVLLVARGGKVLLQRAWGLADRAVGRPVTPDTKFRLGSMNKMFTAAATLQLVQAGELSLDGNVGQYLPDYPNPDIAKVTIRQLLTRTGFPSGT